MDYNISTHGLGVDGFGRAFICKSDKREILFCMLPGKSGIIGVHMLEEQDSESYINKDNRIKEEM